MELHLIEVFACVVEEHSFSKAAHKLRMTPSAVSKLVKALERDLGAQLLRRTTRSMAMTDAGREFYLECAESLDRLRAACRRAQESSDAPHGTLRVSAPLSFGQSRVMPHLGDFLDAYPEVDLDLVLTDSYLDLVAERVGLAIRIGQLDDSTLVARKLLPNRRVLAAAPSYLERHGVPEDVEALKDHACLVSTAKRGELWQLIGPAGAERSIRPVGRARANNADAVKRLAMDGQGIVFLSVVSLTNELKSGALTQVLPAWTGRETGVYAVYPPGPVSPAARTLTDFLAARWTH